MADLRGFIKLKAGKKLLQALIDQNPIAETKNPAIISSIAKKPGTVNIPPETTLKAVGGKEFLDKMPKGAIGEPITNGSLSGYAESGGESWYFSTAGEIGISSKNYTDVRNYARIHGFDLPEKPQKIPTQYNSVHENYPNKYTGQFFKALNEKLSQELQTAKDVYVRFGKVPESGLSKNFATGKEEIGVSAYKGKLFSDGSVIVQPNKPAEYAGNLTLKNRSVYIVKGDLAGIGSDGEPILLNAKAIKKVKESPLEIANIWKGIENNSTPAEAIYDVIPFLNKYDYKKILGLPNQSRPSEGGGQLLNALENPSKTLKTIIPILGTAGILYPQTSEAFGKGASLTETISKMGMTAPAGATLQSWRNPQMAEREALQEPLVDPTTLLAGPARWGGGVANMAFDSLLKLLMGQ